MLVLKSTKARHLRGLFRFHLLLPAEMQVRRLWIGTSRSGGFFFGAPMTTLTDHFSLLELTHSDTAVRLGIDNGAPDRLWMNLFVLAVGLEKVRTLLGDKPLKISSGYRCEELERVLCAKDFAAWCSRHGKHQGAQAWDEYFARKAHPKGYAADFTCLAFGDPLAIVKAIEASEIEFDQCIMEGGSWVHISFAPAQRREVLTATFTSGTASYSKGA